MEFDQVMTSSDLEDEMLDDNGNSLNDTPLHTSAQELLQPLADTAERVGRQVEEFAQALDKFNASKKSQGQKLWEGTWLLMDKYANIAQRTADRVKTNTGSKQAQKNRKSLGDTTAQRQNLMLESNLWTLSAQLLPCKSPDMIETAGFKQNSALAELHRYSTDSELWSAFLDVDIIANQYEMLLEWLQEWKRKTSDELKDSDLDSYDQTQRGQGLWSDGNIFTQAPIKRQKVARAHPGPLNPTPDIRNVHIRKTDQEVLVTQMDPDAPLRQQAVREPEDDAFENAAWHASWELLRRGCSVQESRQWWEERNELWRSLVARNPDLGSDEANNQAWLRIINLASNREFLDICKELSEENVTQTAFERAVYGILSGDYTASAPVCKDIDDHLFALVNELLVERYQQFVIAYTKSLQDPVIVSYEMPQSTMSEISKYFSTAQLDKSTKAEARQPHKYFQGMLIGDDLPTFLLELGHAAAQMAHLTGQARALFDKDEAQINENAQVAAQDEDIVRIAAHIQLALQPLGALEAAYNNDASTMENNIINYIGLLERHKKYSLLPLYTSQLASERQPRVLGRILSKVTDAKERDLQMRLLKQYHIPVYRVIYTICDFARRTWANSLNMDPDELSTAKVIEYKDKIVRVKAGYLGEMTDEAEARVVEAHEWVNYIDTKNWGMAVWLMTALYKTMLLSGRLAAAKELAERVSLADTSLKVTGMNLGLAALVEDGVEDEADGATNEEDSAEEGGRLASPAKKRKEQKSEHPLAKETTSRTKLAEQSVIWAQLEHLVTALDALEIWQEYADEVETLPRNDVASMKVAKKRLTTALQAVHEALQPLLQHDFLNNPNDEQEDEDLTRIRNHYLPECILAYNSALYFGGHAITRQHLVQCMELAQQVAKNDSLTQAFVAGKRMQELVTAFAQDSQALLRANEHNSGGRSRARGKRTSAGAENAGRADIWQVTWRED